MNIKRQQVLSVAVVVLVLAGLYAILGFMLLPKGGLVSKQQKEWREATALPSDPTIFPTVKGSQKPGIDLDDAFRSTPKAVARGEKLFQANCVACHGPAGEGNGPAAVAFNPKPRNFTSPNGWTNGYTIADIYRTLSKGVPGTGMASYDTLPPLDRFALAHYVQSLGHFDHGEDTPQQIAALDKEFSLSKGSETPSKVAVPTVMKHMAADYKQPPAIPMPPPEDDSEGARLVRRLVKDPGRAARVLAQLPDWQTNLDVLVRAAVADPPQNGLDPGVAGLDARQWELFQQELVGLTGAKGRTPPPRANGSGA